MLLLQKKPAQTEIDKKVSLEVKIDKAVNEKIIQFNSFKKVMADRKEALEQEFVDYCLEIETKRATLKNEVETLEERRKVALRPIDKELTALQRARTAQDEMETRVDNKLRVVEQKQCDLKADLSYLDEREKAVKTLENNAKKQVLKANNITKNALEEENRVKNELEKFNKFLAIKNKQVTELENRLADKEKSLNILITENNRLRTKLDKETKHLESKQATLKLAFQELENKHKIWAGK